MAFRFHHLDDPAVRAEMLRLWAIENDDLVASGSRADCYGSDLLPAGWAAWEAAMPRALAEQDERWLGAQMDNSDFWPTHRPRRLKSGGVSQQRINVEFMSRFLAQMEFNTAYVRGLATVLQARGEGVCEVYRAGPAAEAKAECTSWEGTTVPVEKVLAGHRAKYWPQEDPSAWSIPNGFGCHHSIKAVGAGGTAL